MHSIRLAILLTAVTGCTSITDDAGGGDLAGGKADDLAGRQVYLEADGDPIELAEGWSCDSDVECREERVARMRVTGHDDATISMKTEDLRLIIHPNTSVEVNLVVDALDSSMYGFQLFHRAPGVEEWTPYAPGDDPLTYLYNMTIDSGEFAQGLVVTFEEGHDLIPDYDLRITLMREPALYTPGTELRILVLPVWNFWEWDDDVYETTVETRRLR